MNEKLKLYHEVKGKGEPLVLIAGLSADHLAWMPIIDSLAEHYLVVTFDNAGVGQSPVPKEPHSIRMFAQDTVHLMDELGIEKAHILGQSMGTLIAQYIAADYPERIDKLILSNGFTNEDKTSEYAFRLIGKLMHDDVPRVRIMEALLPWCFSNEFLSHPTNVDLILDLYKTNPHPQTIDGYQCQFDAISQADTTAILTKIKAPTLIIAGEEDLLTTVKDAQELLDDIVGSRLIVIPKGAHVPHVEKPNLFLTLILNFLRGVDEGSIGPRIT